MAKEFGNESLNDQLKKHKESVASGGLTDVLRAEIKAILQTPDSDDVIILLSGKGAFDTYGPKLNKGKVVLSMPEDTEGNYEFYQEELP